MSETVFAQPQNVLDTTVARIADALEDMAPSNVCVDISTSLPANGWSQSSPYVQIWTNNKVTDECAVKVEFPAEATNTGITYLEYEKVAGGVKFTAPSLPSTAIPVIVHIINAKAESITSISADMVSTSAVSGSSNVDEALGALNSKLTKNPEFNTNTNATSEQLSASGSRNLTSFTLPNDDGVYLIGCSFDGAASSVERCNIELRNTSRAGGNVTVYEGTPPTTDFFGGNGIVFAQGGDQIELALYTYNANQLSSLRYRLCKLKLR